MADYYIVTCRQMAYNRGMTDIVELIDTLNGLQWKRDSTRRITTMSSRTPRKKKTPEEKRREREQAAAAAAEKREMDAQREAGESASARIENDSSDEMDSDANFCVAKEGRIESEHLDLNK